MSAGTEQVVVQPPPDLPHGARSSIVAGAAIMVAFFIGLGGWAAVAPLSSAVVAPAVVKVEGNRKTVQHLEGGIVRQIHVKEGDRVAAEQVLIVLDDTQARGTLQLLSKQHAELLAQQARLTSEQGGASSVKFPDALTAASTDPEIAQILAAQTTYFETRRTVLSGQINVMRQKIAQTRERITGTEGQLAAERQQLASIRDELTGQRELFKQGYVVRQRMLELERSAAAFGGRVVETEASVVQLRQSIEELNLQIIQLQADRMAQVANELRDVQVRLIDVEPRLTISREMLKRTTVTAPSTGTVVGLNVFTVGGVIAPGERVMDIVPDGSDLIVEVTLNVDDQKDVRAGMEVEVHLVAYRQRSSPIVPGRVSYVSADRLVDQRTGSGYYVAQVKVDQKEARRLKEVRLAPGMPALVVIPTGERTALDYLLRPLTDSFTRAFREK